MTIKRCSFRALIQSFSVFARTAHSFLLIIVLCFSLLFPASGFADRCDLDAVFSINSKLLEDEKFMNALTKYLGEHRGQIDQTEMEKLQKQFGYSPAAGISNSTPKSAVAKVVAAPRSSGGIAPHFHRGVERALKKLEPYLLKKYDEAMSYLKQGKEGLKKLRDTPGSWNLETIRLNGEEVYSMRLNRGNRLVFTLDDNKLDILGVGNQVYDH